MAAGCGHGCSVTGCEALRNQQIARSCVRKRLFDACPSSSVRCLSQSVPLVHVSNGSRGQSCSSFRSHGQCENMVRQRCASSPTILTSTSPSSTTVNLTVFPLMFNEASSSVTTTIPDRQRLSTSVDLPEREPPSTARSDPRLTPTMLDCLSDDRFV